MADRPELMAMGDSIYNGTRSLTTNAESAGFRSRPRSPAPSAGTSSCRPIRSTCCSTSRHCSAPTPSISDTLKASVVANAKGWLDARAGRTTIATRISSIAQSMIGDLPSFTYLNHVSEIEPLLAELRDGSSLDFGALMAILYEAINTTLRAQSAPATQRADGPTRRRSRSWPSAGPRRLLIDIGINDGLRTVPRKPSRPKIDPAAIPTAMHDLGVRLAEMKAVGHVDTIYLNLTSPR